MTTRGASMSPETWIALKGRNWSGRRRRSWLRTLAAIKALPEV